MVKAFAFEYEGQKYITDADTQMDAEFKFWEEFGEDPESCQELENIDEYIFDNEAKVLYF